MPEKSDTTLPETALVHLVQREVAAGRRCIVYTVHTIKHPVSERITRQLQHAGIRTAILKDVPTDRREEWVAQQESIGVQCLRNKAIVAGVVK